MKYYLIIVFFSTAFIYAQELSSHKYDMNTIKIIHVENDDVYRIGIKGLGSDFLKKSSEGKDIAELNLTDKSKKIACRGLYFRDGFFYSVSVHDDFEQTNILLKKIDKDLNVISEELIFTAPGIGENRKGKAYFEHNENGFVLIREFTNRIKVTLESYTYDFKAEEVYSSKLSFLSRRNLKTLDFELSKDLKAALILDADEPIGTLKKKTLKRLESYLVYVVPKGELTAVKLSKDEDYSERSFNLTFDGETIVVANLNFQTPSNILAGYTLKNYSVTRGNEVTESSYFPFDDYVTREEWGPELNEVQKRYKKDKNGKGSGYESFAALEITDLFVNGSEAFLIVREVFDLEQSKGVNVNAGNQPGQPSKPGPKHTHVSVTYKSKRYKEFQLTKLDLQSNSIVWWNRIYNTPYTNGTASTHQVGNGDFFWNDEKTSSFNTVYYPYLEDNKIVLIYPTFEALYEDNRELKTELINQRRFIPTKFMAYSHLGKSEIDMESGEVENSLLYDQIDGLGKIVSAKIININGIYITEDKVITPIEELMKGNSILMIRGK